MLFGVLTVAGLSRLSTMFTFRGHNNLSAYALSAVSVSRSYGANFEYILDLQGNVDTCSDF